MILFRSTETCFISKIDIFVAYAISGQWTMYDHIFYPHESV